MSSVNVIFVGNFLYPEGLADTKRVQHFINAVISEPGNSAQVLLLRQGHPGRDHSRLSGNHLGVRFETIGNDVRGSWLGLSHAMWRYLRRGIQVLSAGRVPGAHNVVYLYGVPNFESIVFVLAARLLGYRVVMDIVEDIYLTTSNATLASRLKAASADFATARIFWFADAVIVISSYLQNKLERISAGRIPVMLIPIAVDCSRVTMSPSLFNRPVQLFYAGSFGDKDGVENLIAAFEQVAKRHTEIELVMTGRGMAEHMEKLRARARRSTVGERIHFMGFLPDDEYFAALAKCDIPCMVRVRSNYAERGFPFKLGEYLATGRPVVAAAVGDVSRYLADRHSALLIEPGSVTAIVEAIEFLLANEVRALNIGRAGRAVAESHFSATQNGRLLLQLVNNLPAPP